MKSIKVLLLAGFTIFQLGVNAQTPCNSGAKENFGSDEQKCKECLSLYTEYLKQKNYADAIKYWRCAYKICPEYKSSLYTNGGIIYSNFIDNEKDAATKDKYIDTLFNLYEQQIKIFGDCPEYYDTYGTKMLKYRKSNSKKIVELLGKAIDLKVAANADPSCITIYSYYTALYLEFQAKNVECDKMVNEYLRCLEFLDKALTDKPDDSNCKLARETVEKYATPCLDCDKLTEIYTKKFETLPSDKDGQIKELKKMSDMLSKKECKGEIIDKIAEKMYELEPSCDAAFAMWASAYNKNKYSDAMGWIKKALDACPDEAKYHLAAAQTAKAQGSYSTAISYAKTAIAKSSTNDIKCDAYNLIAQCIANTSSCGGNEFQRKWVFCLALDYLDKAKALGCSVGGLYANYSARCPTSDELFDYGKPAGTTVTVECYGESTKLRVAQ